MTDVNVILYDLLLFLNLAWRRLIFIVGALNIMKILLTVLNQNIINKRNTMLDHDICVYKRYIAIVCKS
jgi:hypothetical protein